MEDALAMLAGLHAWFSSQQASTQVAIVAGVLLGLYPVLVVLRVLVAALYAAFRGLG